MQCVISAVVISVLRWWWCWGFRSQLFRVRMQRATECYFEAARKICGYVAVYIQADLPLIANNFTETCFSTSAGRYYTFQWVSLLFGTSKRTRKKKKSKHCLMAWFSPNPLNQFYLSQMLCFVTSCIIRVHNAKRVFLSIQSFHLKRCLQCLKYRGKLVCLGQPAMLQEQGTVGRSFQAALQTGRKQASSLAPSLTQTHF